MARVLTLLLLFALTAASGKDKVKFEGVWRGERDGKTYVVLTILSDNPLRGTMARGSSTDLFIQDTNVVKGRLRFKTIDPNDGMVIYEMNVISAAEARLWIGGRETLILTRK